MQPVVSFICLAFLFCVAFVSGVHVCMAYDSSLCVLDMYVVRIYVILLILS